MRLWHQSLIPKLDNHRLGDLHQTCCNLRGLGWGRRNRLINFVFEDLAGEEALVSYHWNVLREMQRRGFNYAMDWWLIGYCGQRREPRVPDMEMFESVVLKSPVYDVMDEAFLQRDLDDLKARGWVPFPWS